MAVSEKYSKFSKTRRSNLKGKASGPAAYFFSGSSSCEGFGAYAYTSTPILSIDTVLYYDEALTQLYYDNVGNLFIHGGNAFFVDENSIIYQTFGMLNSQYNYYSFCGSSTVIGSIYSDSIYALGNYIYDTCYANPANRIINSNFVVDLNNAGFGTHTIYTNGEGAINDIIACE